MKVIRFWMCGLGVALCLGTARAQQVAPKIVCDEPVFDFGDQDNSTTVEHAFAIRNDGNATLEISGARPSCGCTVADISNKALGPGETATITAKLNLTGRTGKQHKTITVASNDPQQPQTVLTLTGTATTQVEVAPRSLHAANLTPGMQVTNIIKVTSLEEEPLEILSADTGNPMITTEVVEVVPGKEYDVVVQNSPELPKGPTFGRIAIRTSSPRLPMANVAYRYNVIGEISVYPQELVMAEAKQPVNKTIVVTPGTVTDFKVTNVQVPDQDIGVKISKLGGGRYRVTLTNIVPSKDLNGQAIHVLTTAANMENVPVKFKVLSR